MGDEQAHGGGILINEAEIIMITELDESLCGSCTCLGGRRGKPGAEPHAGVDGGAGGILE